MIIIVPSLKLNNEHSIKADYPIIMLTMRTINGENKKRKKNSAICNKNLLKIHHDGCNASKPKPRDN